MPVRPQLFLRVSVRCRQEDFASLLCTSVANRRINFKQLPRSHAPDSYNNDFFDGRGSSSLRHHAFFFRPGFVVTLPTGLIGAEVLRPMMTLHPALLGSCHFHFNNESSTSSIHATAALHRSEASRTVQSCRLPALHLLLSWARFIFPSRSSFRSCLVGFQANDLWNYTLQGINHSMLSKRWWIQSVKQQRRPLTAISRC